MIPTKSPYYPEGFAHPRHCAWVLLLYWRECVCVCANLLCCERSCRLLLVYHVPRTSCLDVFPSFVFSLQRNFLNLSRDHFKVTKNALGSLPGRWGALGAQNASRFKKDLKLGFLALPFGTVSKKQIPKESCLSSISG